MATAILNRTRSSSVLPIVVIVTVAVFAALLFGLLVPFMGPYVGGGLAVMIAGAAIATSRLTLAWSALFIGIVVSGLAQLYLPQYAVVRWLIPLASWALVLHVMSQVFSRERNTVRFPQEFIWVFLLFVFAFFTALANWRGTVGFIQGAKLYFQLWGLMIGLALLPWKPKTLDRFLVFFFLAAMIQLPFALHQYIYIVPERYGLWMYGVVPLDVVSGTLGADRLGSGKNMVLSAFLVLTFSFILALWKSGAIRIWWLVFCAPVLLLPLFLNESKYASLMLACSMLMMYRSDLIRRPVQALVILISTALLLAGLLLTYSTQFGQGRTVEETVQYTIDSNFGGAGYGNRLLNRVTAITFWAEKHGLENLPETLVGHGLGSAHDTAESYLSSVKSLATTQYAGYGIGLTSFSMLLWDIGLLGFSLVCLVFWSFFRAASRLSDAYRADPWRHGVFEGMQVALFCCFMMIPHNGAFAVDAVFQTLVFFVFGYIAYWSLRHRRSAAGA